MSVQSVERAIALLLAAERPGGVVADGPSAASAVAGGDAPLDESRRDALEACVLEASGDMPFRELLRLVEAPIHSSATDQPGIEQPVLEHRKGDS